MESSLEKIVTKIAIAVLLVATLGTVGFNLLGNASFVSNYTDTFNASSGYTGSGRIFLSNSDLKTDTLWIYNSTYSAVVTTDYTIDISTGIVTIVTQTNGGKLDNGSRYTASYQKDSVPAVVKSIAVLVISLIGAFVLVRIFIRQG